MKISFNRNFIKYWLPIIFWMALIFWMSTETFSSENTFSWLELVLGLFIQEISSQELSFIHSVIRKAGHGVEYFILGLLLFRSFRGNSVSSWNWRWFFLAMVVLVLSAASDEFHQSFVSTRTASAVDVGIDTIAGILAQFVGALWYRSRKK